LEVAALSGATYIGQLQAVVLADGSEVDVLPVPLYVVPGVGLATALNRRQGDLGYFVAPGDGRPEWMSLAEVVYHRRRPEGDHWYHEVEDGKCAFVGASGPPVVLLSVPAAVVCDRLGDFICGG
jgi:hypothetical protein